MNPARRSAVRVAALAGLALLAACGACGAGDRRPADGAPGPSAAPVRLTVLAAASLAGAFEEVVGRFEADRPGVDVVLSTAGSPALARQVLDGAEVDVLATADRETMAPVAAATGARPTVFATNELAIAVPPGNPGRVRAPADLADRGRRIGLCAPEVPCGRAARQGLARVGVVPAPDTEEPDVTALLAKVAAGDLDAGVVYATDVRARRGAGPGVAVDGVAVPDAAQVRVEYPVAVVTPPGSPRRREAAEAFVRHLRGPGRRVLADAGFGAP